MCGRGGGGGGGGGGGVYYGVVELTYSYAIEFQNLLIFFVL